MKTEPCHEPPESSCAPPAAGQLRGQTMLGTDAVYRILHVGSDLVEVEVQDAPGLAPGHRMHLTHAAVRAMAVLDGTGPPG